LHKFEREYEYWIKSGSKNYSLLNVRFL